MDDNHDNIIDYNNVVNYIEHCEISKNSEEQANNNQLFWSIIDQYQVLSLHSTSRSNLLLFPLLLLYIGRGSHEKRFYCYLYSFLIK